MSQKLNNQELEQLRKAKQLLENSSLVMELTNLLGKPIELGLNVLPVKAEKVIAEATNKALNVALKTAITTMETGELGTEKSNITHKVLTGITGSVSGFFGLTAIAMELPVSTTIMLRSICDIARSEGFFVDNAEVSLECLTVFALGGPAPTDDSLNSAYYVARVSMAKALAEASEYLAERIAGKEIIDRSAPALLNFIGKIASRFSVEVSEEVIAKSIPILSVLTGGAINIAFTTHFQKMAEGHFIVRRLENTYGKEYIKALYEKSSI